MMRPIVLRNVQTLRKVNAATILEIIRDRGPIARTKLARMTGLTPATAFAIVDELVQKDLVVESGLGKSHGGRRPKLYTLNPDAPCAAGLEVRGNRVIVLVMDLSGRIRRRAAIPLRSRGQDDVLAAMKTAIRAVLQPDGGDEKSASVVVGIGLAMPGLLNTEAGVAIGSSNFGWSELPICEVVRREFGLPAVLEHNVRCQTFGESFFGAGKGASNLMCVNVGAGISAGIVIDNTLYRGESMRAGELGHVCVDQAGPRCGCGNYGCLEALASETALVRRAAQAVSQGSKTLIMEREDPEASHGMLAFGAILEAAGKGDSLARSLLEEGARYLGLGLGMALSLLNPALVIIGGEITVAWDFIYPVIKNAAKATSLAASCEDVEIVRSALGVEAGSIGAASLVLREAGLLQDAGVLFKRSSGNGLEISIRAI